MPDVSLCAALASPDQTQRTREDELLGAFLDMRTAGGITCGTASPSTASAPLRLDMRLVCEARALAADMAMTQSRSLTDSEGRDTQDRLKLVGYAYMEWAENFEPQASSASVALGRMLADAGQCTWLTHPQFRDVGVGNSGRVYVITLGTQ
jgi:uncharacterized protein YkwD